MFILDTNTVIYYFKRLGQVSANLLQTPPREVHIPAIVIYELEVGIAKSSNPQKRIQQLASLISVVTVIPFGQAEAASAANIRAELEKRGQTIGPYDILIAATALANKATLVTHNTNEFSRVPNLQIIDWYI